MKSLKNHQAVITGGSDGIGLGIAKAFVENGADVLLVARNIKKLEKVSSELSQYGQKVNCISADLSDIHSIEIVANKILEIYPAIDILVNNAGIARFSQFNEVEMVELDAHINLNIKVPFILTQKLLSALKDKKGNVINISSFFSHRMLPGRPSTAYSLTKGALDSFTKSLAYELGPSGIRVNAIAPGTVNTPLVQANIERLSDEDRAKFPDMIKTIYPLGRIGEPEDLGGIAVFLASDQAKWITGAIMNVDGGLTTT